MTPPVKVGDVLALDHRDCCYGQGTLHLRVTKVGAVVQLRDGPRLELEGIELRADGSQLLPPCVARLLQRPPRP